MGNRKYTVIRSLCPKPPLS